MKNINHLTPILRFFFPRLYIVCGRESGKYLIFFNLCKDFVPELKFDINHDFPFNPKHCPKVENRRIRKACYQSFALYKKSYKPNRLPRFRIIKDELQWLKKDEPLQGFDDCSRWITEEFHCQFLQLLDPEPLEFGQFIPKGIIHRDI